MKLLASIKTKDFKSYIEHGVDGFLLPLEDFSSDYQQVYSLDEILFLRKQYPNLLLFVILNQMVFNEQLEDLKEILKTLSENHLDGIFFYDFSLYQLHQKLGLQIPLIWNQTHMVTNQETANFLYEKGISYGVLTGELTKDEIESLVRKSKMSFFIPLVGYMPVGLTRRKLLTNFYKKIGKERKKELFVHEANSQMPFWIIEQGKGSSLFYGRCFNAASYYEDFIKYGISYGILKEDFQEHNTFLKVLSLYANEKDYKKLRHEVGLLIGRNSGFLKRKTVFRVKKK